MIDPLQHFEAVCAAMTDPDFYPHPVSAIRRLDTHISVVFLTGQWAYKLKKPLNLGFLDFRNLSDRQKFCDREVILNRRLSQGIYIRTVPIVEDENNGFSLSNHGKVVEYAVQMIQLPDQARLQNLMKAGAIARPDLERLGSTLACFHETCERSAAIDSYGRQEMINFNSEENFRQIDPYAVHLLDGERWKFVCEVNRSFLFHHSSLFERRVAQGKIRDGHGDLRTDHVYFFNGIQIIDCIEFNDRFRYGDVANDLAFLHMDMEQLGYPELSQAVLRGYLDISHDPELFALMDFYSAYRAIVRLKVACIRYAEVKTEKEQGDLKAQIITYLNQAYRYTVLFSRPTLWALAGLPASGKSTLAQQLAQALGLSVLGSDAVRKELDPLPEIVAYGKGQYTTERRRRIYAKLLALAHEKLKIGRSVILDATYANCSVREEVVQLASDIDAYLIFVECECSRETIAWRLKAREASAGLSDARLQHLDEAIKQFEPLGELSPETHIKIRTEATGDASINRTLYQLLSEAYLCKSAQIKNLVA